MSRSNVIGIIVTLTAVGAIILLWREREMLRVPLVWDLSYVIFGCGIALVLSTAEWLIDRLTRMIGDSQSGKT